MSLKYILLGLLHEPASGYDLRTKFTKSLNHFWAANLSQIYPSLASLEEQGFLKSKVLDSDKGPPRKIYRRTASGARELVNWLSEGPHINDERRHYLAQVNFLAELDDQQGALAFMKSLRTLMMEKLQALEKIEQEWSSCDPRYPDELPSDQFYSQITLDLGLRIFAAHVQWCNQCIERIESRGKPSGRKAKVNAA